MSFILSAIASLSPSSLTSSWRSLSLLLLLWFGSFVSASPARRPGSWSHGSYRVSPESNTLHRSRCGPGRSKQPSSYWLHAHRPQVGQTALFSGFDDFEYLTTITVGDESFLVSIDTGSSDTWLIGTGFTCLNITDNTTIPEASCGFGSPTYTPASTFEQIPDQNFNLRYGDGSYVTGILGYENVTLAGITVPHQEIGVGLRTGFFGNNQSVGLVGLAYPSITQGYAGNDPAADNRSDPTLRRRYSSIINTIFFVENLTQPLFSLSLSRNPGEFDFGGYLTIGGVPDISMPTVNASSEFIVAPLEVFKNPRFASITSFSFYAITIDGLVYGSFLPGSGKSNTQMIVDSGTTLNYFPDDDAAMINALFDPPAVLDPDYGLYLVECNATSPELGVTISGRTFYINALDLTFDGQLGGNLCLSGIQSGGEIGTGFMTLGDVFLKNVLAVFDVGSSVMAFSAREYYAVE